MRALALEHLRSNSVGIFGEVLEERGVVVDRVRLDAGERLPDWECYDVVVGMGAAIAVWEEEKYPWLVPEKRLIREAVVAGRPYFGVCFGAQLLAAALGARSYGGPEPEIGLTQVLLTPAARRDPVFRGLPAQLEVCEWHSNHFDLPTGAVRLARSPRYANQAIRYGRVAYAIQCHLEPSLDDIRAWLALCPEAVVPYEARHGVRSVAALLDEYALFVPLLQETARQLFGRWLEHALALGGLAAAAGARRRDGPSTAARAAPPRSGADAAWLVERDGERARIGAALDAARRGRSAVVVLRGEGGLGKTALLEDAVTRGRGLRILRAAGIDSPVELPFAGLAKLLRPLARSLAGAPAARRRAVAAVLGLGDDAPGGDRFAAYAGAFDLLTRAAEATPLLLVVDDVHWLDDPSAEALEFVAGRLGDDGIALLVASESDDDFGAAEELRPAPLTASGARAVLRAQFDGRLAPAIGRAVAKAARGNPLGLLEIPLALTPDERAGVVPPGSGVPASAEWAFVRRIDALPPDARQAMLIAALAPDADLAGLERAWSAAGLDSAAVAAAERAGLARRADGRLLPRHPLVRAALVSGAPRDERRAAHLALGESGAGDRRAWHLGHASAGPDEAIAAGVEDAAQNARGLGAYSVAARGFALAARLSAVPAGRAARLLAAAEAAHLAGHVNASLDHAAAGLRCGPAPPVRAALEHLRGRVLARSGSAERARDALVVAAATRTRGAPAEAAEMLADAVLPALRAGSPRDARRIAARSLRLADGASGRPLIGATLMLGTALVFAGDHTRGARLVDRAYELVVDPDGSDVDQHLRAYLGAALAVAGRNVRAHEVLGDVVEAARRDGSLAILPFALVRMAGVELETGRWTAAAAALQEALRLARETGGSADYGLALGTLAWLEAVQGRAERCRAHAEEALELAGRLGSGSRIDRTVPALGLLELGRGRPDRAIPPLEDVVRFQRDRGWSDAAAAPHRTPDLVEAYSAAGRAAEARALLRRFTEEAARTGRASAVAAAARCRGLLAAEHEIDRPFSEALACAAEDTGPFERARTRLVYGARLAAVGRRCPAREQLGAALERFESLGATPWADRAGRELRRAGGAVPTAVRPPIDRLTPLELEIASAAAEGTAPDDLAARLLVGPRTARLRLASAMRTLGAASPADLPSVLGSGAGSAQ